MDGAGSNSSAVTSFGLRISVTTRSLGIKPLRELSNACGTI